MAINVQGNIQEKITDEIQKISFTKVAPTTPLLTEVLDSIGRVDLAVALEETFKVSIENIEINEENFGTVERLQKFLTGKMAAQE